MVGNIAEFGNDFATLVELQAKLALYDSKECVSRATFPVVFLGVGAAVALSSLPVLLLGLAGLLSMFTTIPLWGSCLIVAGIALLIAGLVGFLSYRKVAGSVHSFRRSSEEFTRNLSWLRTVLVHSGRVASRDKP